MSNPQEFDISIRIYIHDTKGSFEVINRRDNDWLLNGVFTVSRI